MKNSLIIILIFFSFTSATSKSLDSYLHGSKWGFKNEENGQIVIPAKYDAVFPFSEGVAAVLETSKWGYINESGQYVIPPQFDYAMSFHKGLALIQISDKRGYIDHFGKIVIPCKFYSLGEFADNGLAVASTQECTYPSGFIGKSGEFVIPPIYDIAQGFSEGLAAVSVDFPHKYGFINQDNIVVIPYQFENVKPFAEGFAAVKMNGKWGYIDKMGRIVIKCEYQWAHSFSCGLAAVQSGNKYGFINKHGEIIIPFKFDEVKVGFDSVGLAMVVVNGETCWTDIEGILFEMDENKRRYEKLK